MPYSINFKPVSDPYDHLRHADGHRPLATMSQLPPLLVSFCFQQGVGPWWSILNVKPTSTSRTWARPSAGVCWFCWGLVLGCRWVVHVAGLEASGSKVIATLLIIVGGWPCHLGGPKVFQQVQGSYIRPERGQAKPYLTWYCTIFHQRTTSNHPFFLLVCFVHLLGGDFF